MTEFIFFLIGFFSALVFVAAFLTVTGIWWFFSYGKHLKARQTLEQQTLSKADQLRKTRRMPIQVETEDM